MLGRLPPHLMCGLAFPRPFDQWYTIANCVQCGEKSAKENRLRWRPGGDCFHMWHTMEFFSGSLASQERLHLPLSMDWHTLEAPQYLFVPTPSALAYSARWMPPGLLGRGATPQTRRLIDAILHSEWAVLALLCFLHAARDGLLFFTKCPDPRLASRIANEPGVRGTLIRFSLTLLGLIRLAGVAAILEGTSFDLVGAEALLDFSERLDWSLPERGEFVWYSWSRGSSLRMPHWDGVSTKADNWYKPLPDTGTPSYGAVIASGDGWGAAVSSARLPVEPSPESLPVMAASVSPSTDEVAVVDPGAGTTEDPPVGPSKTPVVEVPTPSGSPRGFDEEPTVEPTQVVPRHTASAGKPIAENPTGRTPMSVQDPAAPLVSDITETGTQTPSTAAIGVTAGAPTEERPATAPDAQDALRSLQLECRYAGVPAPPTLAARLMSVRAWLVAMNQLKARVAGIQFAIRQHDTDDDLLRGETMARICAAQDHLAVLSAQVANKRPYGAVDTDPAMVTLAGSEPCRKRQHRD